MKRLLGLLLLSAGFCGLGPLSESAVASGPWNGHAVAFTFTSDDGNKDNLTWARVFHDSLGSPLSFTAFVVSDQVNSDSTIKLTAGDLYELNSLGIEIGSHSKSHPRLTDVQNDSVLFVELRDSGIAIQDFINNHVPAPFTPYRCRTFAYPEHAHDLHVMAMAESVGYAAARDGGLDSEGRPNFSEGQATWSQTDLFEVPLTIVSDYLVGPSTSPYDETTTRAMVDSLLQLTYPYNYWINLFCHTLADIDENHMKWILDEFQQGDVWIANFGTVSDFYRQGHGLPIPGGVRATTGIGDTPDAGARLALRAVPNPLNSSAMLSFRLEQSAPVRLEIIGLNGAHVTTLIVGPQGAGSQSIVWDGRDDRGVKVATGVYLAHLQVGTTESVTRLVKLR